MVISVGLLFAILGIYILFGGYITSLIQTNPLTRIDYSCETASDCAIKEVGNMCGAYYKCVNKDFKPHPPELTHKMCGQLQIQKCDCIENKCEEDVSVDLRW